MGGGGGGGGQFGYNVLCNYTTDLYAHNIRLLANCELINEIIQLLIEQSGRFLSYN